MDDRGKMIRRIELPRNEELTGQEYAFCMNFGHYAL